MNEMKNSNEKKGEMSVFSDMGFSISADLESGTLHFCSMQANTDEEKKRLYNAMNNPDFRLAEMINKTINITDVFIEVVNCTNEETGETATCPRVVLIDKNGKSYQCVSLGIYSAIKKAVQVYGVPTWSKGINFEVHQISKGNKKILSLIVA